MKIHSISPIEIFLSLKVNRSLLASLIRRDVAGRYKGSLLGLFWSFFNPVLMLAIYTFVFSVVFKARWNPGGDSSKSEFALVLFAGLMVFNIFAECVNRAPGLIVSNPSYVKKVVFPLEIMPIVVLGGALFHALVSFFVWLVFSLFVVGVPHLTAVFFPLALLPLIFFTLGCSWLLASLGVYLRDLGQFIGIFVTTLTFLSPIFYPIESLPKEYQPLFLLNPLTPVIEQTRDVLVWGVLPDMHAYLVALVLSAVWCGVGFAWFQRTRKGFADVL